MRTINTLGKPITVVAFVALSRNKPSSEKPSFAMDTTGAFWIDLGFSFGLWRRCYSDNEIDRARTALYRAGQIDREGKLV